MIDNIMMIIIIIITSIQFLLPLLVAGIANAAIYCKLKVFELNTNNNMLMLSMMILQMYHYLWKRNGKQFRKLGFKADFSVFSL